MMGKILMVFMVVAILVTSCAAPAQEDTSQAPKAWCLTVVSKAGPKELTLDDIQALPSKEVEFESKETGTLNNYKGVMLRNLLDAAGADIAALESVDVEASDGFLATFDRGLALAEDVVLVYEMDGGALPSEMGEVRMLAPGQATKFQVKSVTRISVR